ncbi:NIL domain-containing protein [Nigerium massiliense]|uniref:NIL domain-containing protein n=1 Tax=Nigerium massiliense TaxID=1522317 RepID=UPI00058E1CBB|nr:NIL domain-containing protein [Nigerium massiliense]
MTTSLVFVGAHDGRATLSQLVHDLGLRVEFIAEQRRRMEFWLVSVVTVQLDGDAEQLAEAGRWIARRGILTLAA